MKKSKSKVRKAGRRFRRRLIIKKDIQWYFGLVAFFLIMASNITVWIGMNLVMEVSLLENVESMTPKSNLFADSAWIMFALVLGNGLAVLILAIFFSHQVAGPIYRIESSMREFLEDHKKSPVHLRSQDLLKDMAQTWNQILAKNR